MSGYNCLYPQAHESVQCRKFPIPCPNQCGIHDLPRDEVRILINWLLLFIVDKCCFNRSINYSPHGILEDLQGDFQNRKNGRIDQIIWLVWTLIIQRSGLIRGGCIYFQMLEHAPDCPKKPSHCKFRNVGCDFVVSISK